MTKIKLGDQVRDKVTGFAGVAVARTQWLHGCDRIAIQPPVDKDGKLPDNASFDIMSVELVKAEKPVKTSKTGGPQREQFLNRR
jgi:hypothetical protein